MNIKAHRVFAADNEVLGTYMSQKPAVALARQQGFTATDTSAYDRLVELDADTDPRECALALHLDCTLESVSECRYGDNQYESTDEPGKYLVLTDSEADEAHLEWCKQYADENLVPENASPYLAFDYEGYARDNSDRGETLGRYDSEEHEVSVDDTTYYIYRTN